jgi:hypothetical protein
MDGGVADTLSVVTRLYRYGRRCGRHNLLLHAPFGAAELFNTTRARSLLAFDFWKLFLEHSRHRFELLGESGAPS